MEKYDLILNVIKNTLGTLSHILEKAEQHLQEKGIEEGVLLNAALAPDMFNFTKQIQVGTDDARRNLYLLAGKEHIKLDDTETTIAQLKARVQKTQEIINALTLDDFKDADTRQVSLYWMGDMYVEGKDFVNEFVFQNFFFHTSMAYAILRNQGVNIGKMDFITKLNMKPKTA